MKINGVEVRPTQADVYEVLKAHGPLADHVLIPIAQHQLGVHQSSSGIRTRRRELEKLGLVTQHGTVKTGSGRTAMLFKVV